MNVLNVLRSFFRNLRRKSKLDRDLEEELQFHLEMQTQENIQAGMPPQEARRLALLSLGGMEQTKEKCRDEWGVTWLLNLWADVRFGLRKLAKAPVSSIVVILTLGLIIGALTLAMAVIEHEKHARMPYPEPDRLVHFWRMGGDRPDDMLPGKVYEAGQNLEGLDAIGAVGYHDIQVLTGEGEPQTLSAIKVSSSMFDVTGVSPLLGRTFTEEEARREARLAVISFEIWQNSLSGRSSIVGETIHLNEEPYTVVGVMPEGMSGSILYYGVGVWLPGNFAFDTSSGSWLRLVGRLKSGRSMSQLRGEVQAVVTPAYESYAAAQGMKISNAEIGVFPVSKRFDSTDTAEVVFVVMIPLFILLIACFNVTNILLGRMAARGREMAVRFSLGARRGRLIRQLLVESMSLSAMGGALGVLVSVVAARWAADQGLEAQFSPYVLLGTCAISVLIGVVVGWLPARRATRGDLVSGLKEGGGSSSGGVERHRLRNFLVAGQVAMATTLCITAGLMVRSYMNKKAFDPGFETGDLVCIAVSPRDAYEDSEKKLLYYRQAVERLQAVPGVKEVSVASSLPIERHPFPMGFRMEGEGDRWKKGQIVQLNIVSPNLFETVKLPVLKGRALSYSDRRGAPPVLVVNQSFVKAFFSDEEPIGNQIRLRVGDTQRWYTIVGVVADQPTLGARFNVRWAHEKAEAYLSALQVAPRWGSYYFMARVTGQTGTMKDPLREAVRSLDPNQPVSTAFTMNERMKRIVQRDVAGVQAILGVGVFGFLMAILGIYGVVSYSVIERTHEIGVRMALGATKSNVLTWILKHGMALAVIGVITGFGLATFTTLGSSELLYDISPLDAGTYLSVLVILMAAVFCACLVPALKVMRIDPMQALRYE